MTITSSWIIPHLAHVTVYDFKHSNLQINKWSIIFVHRTNLEYFITNCIQRITVPFSIIVSEGVASCPQTPSLNLLLEHPCFMHWYGTNFIELGPMYTCLPVGITNRKPYLSDDKSWIGWEPPTYKYMPIPEIQEKFSLFNWEQFKQSNQEKSKFLHISYTTENTTTHCTPEQFQYKQRENLDAYLHSTVFEKIPLCDWDSFIDELGNYQFTLCPNGVGLDTIRVWEALCLGVIPIVFNSPIVHIYKNLPVIILDSFEQINPTFLQNKRRDILHRDCDLSALNFEYWKNKITTPRYTMLKCLEYSMYKANQHQSELSSDLLTMYGMSGLKFRHLLNNIGSFPNAKYLEIGIHTGSILFSFMFNNSASVIAVDNWSQFNEENAHNVEKYCGNNRIEIIEQDCWTLDPYNMTKSNMFFYDGDHSYESQYRALVHFHPCLEDEFILIVDDWNLPHVRKGTLDSVEHLGFDVLRKIEIQTTTNDWHNGTCLMVIQKK